MTLAREVGLLKLELRARGDLLLPWTTQASICQQPCDSVLELPHPEKKNIRVTFIYKFKNARWCLRHLRILSNYWMILNHFHPRIWINCKCVNTGRLYCSILRNFTWVELPIKLKSQGFQQHHLQLSTEVFKQFQVPTKPKRQQTVPVPFGGLGIGWLHKRKGPRALDDEPLG